MAGRITTGDGGRLPVEAITVAELRELLAGLRDDDMLHFDHAVDRIYAYRQSDIRFPGTLLGVVVIETASIAPMTAPDGGAR